MKSSGWQWEPGAAFHPSPSRAALSSPADVVQAPSWGWESAATIGTFAAAVLILALFVIVESRVKNPLIPLSLFKAAGVSVGGLVSVANFFAILGVTFLLTLFLMNSLLQQSTPAHALGSHRQRSEGTSARVRRRALVAILFTGSVPAESVGTLSCAGSAPAHYTFGGRGPLTPS
nr:hypothetical protein [Mycetocola manganoxydans]